MEAGAWGPAFVNLVSAFGIRRPNPSARFFGEIVVFQEEKDPARSAAFGAVWMQSPLSV